jgi:hypothetical protein
VADLLALAYGTLSYAKCQISTFLARTYFHGLSLFEPTPVSRRGLLYHSIERFLKKVDPAAFDITATIKAHKWGEITGKQKLRKLFNKSTPGSRTFWTIRERSSMIAGQ